MRPSLALLMFCSFAACSSEDNPTDEPDAGICLPAPPTAVTYPDPACPITKPAPDALDEALAMVGLDRCTLGFTEQQMSTFGKALAHDPFRLPW